MNSVSPEHLFNSFSIASTEDWLNAAKLELDGADPFQTLRFQKGNLSLLPYYEQKDVSRTDHFQLPPSANDFLGVRAWHNMPTVEVKTDSESNLEALSHLNSGADGIVFKLKGDPDVSALLENIEWPYCAISFEGVISARFLGHLHAHARKQKFDVTQLTGCVFGMAAFDSVNLFEDWKNFHLLGIDVAGKESADEEIAFALTQAVNRIDILTNQGLSLRRVLQAMAFNVQIDEDFFLSIAKLKALRHLWNTVANTFDVHATESIFIHATSPAWNQKEYLPNSNMLKGTTAALSAIFGGCDGLTISPEENGNTLMTRIARNVSTVLREESHLSKVADPTAGSYYIESLTDQLATRAWKKFQNMMG